MIPTLIHQTVLKIFLLVAELLTHIILVFKLLYFCRVEQLSLLVLTLPGAIMAAQAHCQQNTPAPGTPARAGFFNAAHEGP